MQKTADWIARAGLMLRLLPVALVAAGCASHWTIAGDRPSEPLFWPPPPQEARVRYVGTIRGFTETGASLGSVLRRAVFGKSAADTMQNPVAIAVDEGDGRIAIADAGCRCVHLYLPREKRYWRISRTGREGLESPVSVAFGADHRLYVSDSVRRSIDLFDAQARHVASLTKAGSEPFQRPTGLAYFGAKKALYVVDTLANRIHAMGPEGNHLFSFGSRGVKGGEFNFPTHLDVSPTGRLYVTDTMNFRVEVFDDRGTFLKAFGHHGDGSGDFAMPKGLASDRNGNVYVVDSLFDNVQVFSDQGAFLLTLGGRGLDLGEFWLPSGAFLDGQTLYICDTYNKRVQLFSIEGKKP